MSKSCFFEKFRNPGTVPGTRVPSNPKNSGSPKVVPWDANPWDSWDWDKNPWDSPGILSFGTQVPGTKILGTGSPVPCPSLILMNNEFYIQNNSKSFDARVFGRDLLRLTASQANHVIYTFFTFCRDFEL